MGLLATRPDMDPRLQPLAYVARKDGSALAEVVELKGAGPSLFVIVEDCRTLERRQIEAWRMKSDWDLVRAAPMEAPEAA